MPRLSAALAAVLLACPIAFAQGAAPAAVSPGPAATTVTSAAASTDSAEVREFQAIEDKWSHAENQHDQFGLDQVMSPLLVNVAADGDITTHNQQVVQAITNQDKMYFLAQKVITVRMLGDVAVVNGTYLLRHHVNDKVVTDNGVFTHVFQRQRSGWMCVNAQRTLVSENSDTRKGKKASAVNHSMRLSLFGKAKKGPY
ncbi:MAG TPA: nuclear transport factor 2 family protein [Terracidiphilus sp.]|nr:nuclear transport factor 2 family protein [Terracidiphilus sp.]